MFATAVRLRLPLRAQCHGVSRQTGRAYTPGVAAASMLTWSTDTLPPGERIAAWTELVGRLFAPLRVEYDAPTPFWIRATIGTLGPLTLLALNGCAHRLSRQEAVGAGDRPDRVVVVLQLAGHSTARGPGAAVHTEPSYAGVLTVEWPQFVDLPHDFHQLALIAPTALLSSRLGDSATTINRVLAPAPATGLLANRISYLAGHATDLDQPSAELACDQLIELLLHALDPVRASDGPERLVHAVYDHIERHLTDPALRVTEVAAALNISVRYLQRLLATSGTTFTRLLAERRVQHARAAFDSDPGRSRTIAQIARHYGFADPTRFSKTFTRHTGVTPRDYRAALVAATNRVSEAADSPFSVWSSKSMHI